MDTKKEYQVYNLEFPDHVNSINIGGYVFQRVSDYNVAFSRLAHLHNSSGSEHSTKIQTGEHQITAIVTIPDVEQSAILEWSTKDATRLLDVLLLLTLFTSRNVFIKDWDNENSVAIIRDHRMHQWDGILGCSINYESRWKHKETGELKTEKEMGSTPVFDYNQIDIGFEKTLNRILETIADKQWFEKNGGGYFLFLFRDVCQRQNIEQAFLKSWTIWERLFALRNEQWMEESDICRTNGDKKISYVLTSFFGIRLDKVARKNISRLAKSRNRLVHFGKMSDKVDIQEKKMFIELTAQLIALLLDLAPSDVLSTQGELFNFLKKDEVKPTNA